MKPFEIIGEEVLNSVIQSINAAVILHDRRLKVIFINDSFEEIFEIKKEQALGKSPLEFLPDFDQRHKDAIVNRLQNTLLTGTKSPVHEFTYYTPTGKLHYLTAISIPIFDPSQRISHVMSIVSDHTSQKKLERELIEAAKLSSVADMAYPLAHEINNPLTGIKLGLSTLYQSLQKKENIHILDGIMKDLGRIQKTVQAFLNAQKSQYRLKMRHQAVIREIIEEVLFHLGGQLDLQSIRVKKSFAKKEANLLMDRDKLYQLFLNLLLNAIQAIPDGGQITISTQIKKLTKAPDRNLTHLCILLSDSGTGIEPQHLSQIFKPFFTSKSFGTGLGLSICKEIVAAHKGFIQVDSQMGKGTAIRIFLPVLREESPDSWR